MRTVGGGLRIIIALLSAPAVAGEPAAAVSAAGRGTRLERPDEHLDEPGVHGDAVEGGGCVEPVLPALGQARGDAGGEGLVGGLRRGRLLVGDVDALGIAAGEPDLDAAVLELGVELECGLAERPEGGPARPGPARAPGGR